MFKNVVESLESHPALRILHTCCSFGPSSFGIGVSALGLAQSQQQAGLAVSLWTCDSLHQQLTIEAANGFQTGSMRSFATAGPHSFGYSPRMEREILTGHGRFDVLHQHGIWTMNSRVSNQWRRSCRKPAVVTVHGALEPCARHHSLWKKRIALMSYEARNLKSTSCFHALSVREALSIRSYGLRAPIAVIPNGVQSSWLTLAGDPDRFRQTHGIPSDIRLMLFLGRIAPIKGLPMLLNALASIRPLLGDWLLVVAGVDQSGHEQELKAQVERLDLQASVRFAGPQYGQAKQDALAASELFVLPSLSEASPMSVLEAMAMGVPVLTTEAASWQELNSHQCGWCTGISQADLADALVDALNQSTDNMKRKGADCRALVACHYTWGHIAQHTIKLYQWLLSGGSAPDFVFEGY